MDPINESQEFIQFSTHEEEEEEEEEEREGPLIRRIEELETALEQERQRFQKREKELLEKINLLEQKAATSNEIGDDLLDLPHTPPSNQRTFARPSIGPWSIERAKKNMSVRNMASKFEGK